MRSTTFLFLISCTFKLLAQQEAMKTASYATPLDIPLVLAANFGELRPNHFHMGVDFKTNGKEGLNIRSVMDGYVSRIKISVGGYGKAIYVTHPNGVTSVYAHCSAFKGKIDSVVYEQQKKEQHYEVELFLPKDLLPVKKGEIIALSGNTGGSTAPHLHFELRDAESGEALNPLAFGFQVADTKPPVIRGVKVYGVDENGYMIPGKSKQITVQKINDKKYTLSGPVSIPAHFCSDDGGIGLAVNVVDYFDGAPNVCGLYASTLTVNEEKIFGQQIDRIYFEDSRYINSHKDYSAFLKGQDYHKHFKNIHNPLGIYTTETDGILKLSPGDRRQVNFTAWDTKKNTSSLQFELFIEQGDKNKGPFFDPKLYYFPEEPINLSGHGFSVQMVECSIYEPLQKSEIDLQKKRFGNPETPVEQAFTVQIKQDKLNVASEKYFIQVITGGGKRKVLKTSYSDGHFIAQSKFMGAFSLQVDTIAPILVPQNFDATQSVQTKQLLTWKIDEKKTDLIDYDLYIDGEWHLLEYEYKGSYLVFKPRNPLKGQKELKIIVRDSCGNTKEWNKAMVFQ
jgi:hypothetical protein